MGELGFPGECAMIERMDGLRSVPDGFAATVDQSHLTIRYRVLSLVPGLRNRIYEQMRADGVLFLIPHPDTTLPCPKGWVVRWEMRLAYPPEDTRNDWK